MRFERELDQVLQEIATAWGIPGLAVGLVQGGEIAYAKGFGVQSLATRAPVTLDSVFAVMSVSKCLVATAVMQWAERGRLDLDAPLVDYLPYLQMDDERVRQITIRQVLSHTSGMPDLEDDEYIELVNHPESDDGAAERFVRSLGDRRLVADPGERFSYSNIGYNVLGDLLAKVSGRSFESTMREEVLVPAGMPNSSFLWTDVARDVQVWPHLRAPEMSPTQGYPYHRADAPSSFLHTTVTDLCHWAIISLKRGSPAGLSLLSPAGYGSMWTPVAKRGDPPGLYEEMGLGWSLGHYQGAATICHGGAGFGWTAFLLLLPEKDCAGVLMCNEESDAHFRVMQAVADTLVGREPQVRKVSAMVPVSRALAEGGIDAACARYSEIRATDERAFFYNEYTLEGLALQLHMAGKLDLAIEMLGLNIRVYPEHVDSYLQQARLDLKTGQLTQASEILREALSIEPGNAAAAGLLSKASVTPPLAEKEGPSREGIAR